MRERIYIYIKKERRLKAVKERGYVSDEGRKGGREGVDEMT